MRDQLYLWPGARPATPLRWSVSRDKRLRDCLRKYYLHHYGSRRGQHAEPGSEAHDAYILKHLRSRYMWVGEVVHGLVENTLGAWGAGRETSVDALVDRGTRLMRAQYSESRRGNYRRRPAVACGLIEHEYGEPITPREWRDQRERMERCVRGFFNLDFITSIRSVPPDRWLALEQLGSFELDGATVLVKPDFAWRVDDGTVVLVDWKTGRPHLEDERIQLGVYGLYALRVWGVSPRRLSARVVYLDGGQVMDLQLTGADLVDAEEKVRHSVAMMRQLGGDEGRPPVAADFPKTHDLSQCSRCAFRRLCGR